MVSYEAVNSGERLDVFLTEQNQDFSRSHVQKLIADGKVMVNGLVATPGMGIHAGDTVCVNGKVIKAKDDKVVLAFYKPVGITCTERDKFAEKTILEYVKYPVRVTYAGRLDKDSEGLILLTNDGDLIQALMKGSHHHEKEYVVKTDKEITDRFLEKMSQGVYLRELDRTTRPCQITGVGKNTFKIVLTQGLNRQIRRMCKELGYTVTSLKRIRIEKITIDGLKIGQYRELTEKEKQNLYENLIMYIEEHLDEDLTLDHLANVFFVSKFHISHVFKENLGLSIHQYITKKRLAVCRDAILSDDNISKTYLSYGFKDYSIFFRAFKKEFGISPKEYRELHKIKEI